MRHLSIILIPVLLFSPAILSADTLAIDSDKKVSAATKARAAATRGLTMTQIERNFGAPDTKLAAVGDPPITRWVYPDYTVYFEHHLVITSVVNR